MRKILIGVMAALVGGGLLAVVPAPTVSAAPANRVARISMASSLAASSASTASSAGAGQATPWPLSHLAVTWTGDPAARVEVRWRDGGGWRPWQAVGVNHDMTDGSNATVYSTLLRATDATRVDTRSSGDARDVTVIAIDTTHATHQRVHASTAVAGAGTNSSARVGQPPVVTRAQWGADESLRSGTPSYAPISKLIVHHTDTQNDDPDPAATVRAIYAYHTQHNGWDDIGYNWLIDEQGRVYEGRYARTYDPGEVPTGEDANGNGVVGAHALNANTGSSGIALLGTFDTQQPTQAALDTLTNLLAWEADRHNIDPNGATPFALGDGTTRSFPNISGHRDTSSTDCPGDATYALLPDIRNQVNGRVAAAYGTTPGYWTAARNGTVYSFGRAGAYGSMAGQRLNAPIVGMAATPTGHGYWLLGSDGGIFSFGDASFYGSTGDMRLNQPVVALEPTITGHGYWLVAKDGGIFSFGDASFYGSTGNMRLNQPVVGMAATPTGAGYWLVATDGGVFSFGDATFHGSTGTMRLNQPILAMTASHTRGGGYWLVAKDGGIFAFDVPYKGSVPGLNLRSYAGTVAMAATSSDQGYYVEAADGGIFSFGDANFLGTKVPISAAGMAVMNDPQT